MTRVGKITEINLFDNQVTGQVESVTIVGVLNGVEVRLVRTIKQFNTDFKRSNVPISMKDFIYHGIGGTFGGEITAVKAGSLYVVNDEHGLVKSGATREGQYMKGGKITNYKIGDKLKAGVQVLRQKDGFNIDGVGFLKLRLPESYTRNMMVATATAQAEIAYRKSLEDSTAAIDALMNAPMVEAAPEADGVIAVEKLGLETI